MPIGPEQGSSDEQIVQSSLPTEVTDLVVNAGVHKYAGPPIYTHYVDRQPVAQSSERPSMPNRPELLDRMPSNINKDPHS